MSARAWRVAAVLIAAAVVAVVAVVLSASSPWDQAPPVGPGRNAPAQVAAMLRGVPQSGTVLGDPSAPVTLDYYGDLECPICREFSTTTLPGLITDYVRPGELKIRYLSLETASRDEATFLAQQTAAYAAGRQGRAWDFIELFYLEQGQEDTGYVTPRFLTGIATQIPGLAVSAWSQERFEPALTAQVQDESRSFAALGLPVATPTLLVRGPRGEKGVQEAATESQVAQLIAAVS